MTTTIGANPIEDYNNSAGFIQTVFTVQLAKNVPNTVDGDFSKYADIIGFSAQTDSNDIGASVTNIMNDPNIATILTQTGGNTNNAVPTYFFSKGKCRDTSLGGNDAINCYPQFNETDDVAEHPFLSIPSSIYDSSLTGMGRVYSETYDDQQQIMYLTFGVPKFNNLSSFYSNAILPNLAQVMNSGGQTKLNQIGTLIGEGLAIASSFIMPVIPLVFLYNALNKLDEVKITKYYDFKAAMPLYYRCVNSMLMHLLVNMGLTEDSFFLAQAGINAAGGSANLDQTLMEGQAAASTTGNVNATNGLPEIFQKQGFDIYKIMLKKYQYDNTISATDLQNTKTSDFTLVNTATDDGSSATDSGSESFPKDAISAFANQLYEASLYIGFRIEKGVDTSESFTSTTGQSTVAQTVNSQIQATRDAKFGAENSNLASIMSAIGGVVSGVANVAGWSGAGDIGDIMAGAGMLDFPDVWKDSNFSKNYSFNMSLRSPYGDPVSILQNLYFPLALLLSGSLPRAIGQSAYTSPFICRAYCKGMFAVPLGMITSITVKRGADQFGWSTQRLPTCLDISFEIKDLSPTMFMGISDTGSTLTALQEVFGSNSTFQEYLMTLSGMGLQERLLWLKQLRLKGSYLFAQLNTSKLSPFYWGAAFGNTVPAKLLTILNPNTKLPAN